MDQRVTEALSSMEHALTLLDNAGEKSCAAELQRAIDSVLETISSPTAMAPPDSAP